MTRYRVEERGGGTLKGGFTTLTAAKAWARQFLKHESPDARLVIKKVATSDDSWGERDSLTSGGHRNPGTRKAIRLKMFTGTVTRKRNGQVVIRGRKK